MGTTEAFVGKVLGDTTGPSNTVLAWIGDELGLWKDLHAQGAATSMELAGRTRLAERPVREWASAMTAAGYLDYDPATQSFALPPEHAPVLAEEAGPMFFGGVHQEFVGLTRPLDRVVESFRTGRGVPQSAFPDAAFAGMDRFTAGWFENLLLPVWIPTIDGLEERLKAGIRVADVGCGRGRALVKLAQAFPKSRFVGFDVYGPNIEMARARAKAAEVDDRVTFVERDATDGIDGGFELVTTFDVLHDAVDPGGLLRAARRGLASDGVYLCVDINCAPKLEDNKGPVASLCGARRSVRRRRPPRRLRKRGAEMAPASRADPAAARALVPRASPWRRRAEHGSPRGGPTDRGPDARPVARARDRDARDRVISNSTERRAARSRR